MAQHYTKQQIESQYEKLPSALKEAIFSAEIAEKMYEIGHRNGLNIEKTGFLAEEAGYIVLGLTHPREFLGQLTERLEITTDKAKEIARQVNHEIFFPLHEALKQAHGVDVKEELLLHEQLEQKYTNSTNRNEQREQIKPQGETIDLRQQYRPRMPDLLPSKVPPINLRVQREGMPQGGVIPKQGVSFAPKPPVSTPRQSPAAKSPPEEVPSVRPGAPRTEEPQPTKSPPSPKATAAEGENVKTSPFGISSGRLVEDWEKKMQPPPLEELRTKNLELGTEATSPSNVPQKEEALKPPEPEKSPVSPPPPNIPLKDEETRTARTETNPIRASSNGAGSTNSNTPQPAQRQDPYREPIE